MERLPQAQVVTSGSWDPVLHRAPCLEPASPSACVSASLRASLMNTYDLFFFFLKLASEKENIMPTGIHMLQQSEFEGGINK